MSPAASPLLSIIVIVHDDAVLLPTAVRSALAQTLADLEVIVVDDASSDGSADVAESLATHDRRIRVVRREINSGGCSAPRNDGLDCAQGRWVMFLDSDDELFPGAAQALLEAGERTDAEVASGLTRRFQVHERAMRPWYPELYSVERVVAGLASEPEILRDTLSTNKAYRRSFFEQHGLRFPLGIHYEDQVFTLEMYLAVERLVLVPVPVYRWNVRTERSSITSRRAELANLRHRLAANRLIDELIEHSGSSALRVAKDVKFVKHDLRLYLNELWERDDAFRTFFVAEVGAYLAGLHEDSWRALPALHRAVAQLIVIDDFEGALDAVEGLRRPQRLPTVLVRRGKLLLLGTRHVDGLAAHRLDVAGTAVASAARRAARLDTADVHEGVLRLSLILRSSRELATEQAPPAVRLLAGRFGVRLLAREVWSGTTSSAAERGLWRASAEVTPSALRHLPGGIGVWHLFVDVDGDRVRVGRPRRWRGPIAFAGAELSYTRGGDLQIVELGSRRTEVRLENLRLRLRYTAAGTAFRAAKAFPSSGPRLIARAFRTAVPSRR